MPPHESWPIVYVENSAFTRLRVPPGEEKRFKQCKVYLDHAGTYVMRNILGRHIPIAELCEFHVESREAK